MSILLWLFLAVLLFLVINYKLYLFLKPEKRLPILMYHHVLPVAENELTVTVEKLDRQFAMLKENGYKTLFFSQLNNLKDCKKKIIITFDDGYLNNKKYLLPLLEKYGFKATIFIPTQLIGKNRDGIFMTFDEIRNLDKNLVEIGLHSHSHRNYEQLTHEEIDTDLKKNIEVLEKHQIPFTKVLAYPYGRFPHTKDFFKILKENKIEFALRIGNKINAFPRKNPYSLNRIDIKNSTTLSEFKRKLILGKLKLF
ncbi:polysaccharide deacetylase family protein [Chryseobacterium sp.]|uniref:polysaccharide deacetylase family protein n=1 Tax=Chryseobacterium sp. TaxID=1871047 RepID=UPI0011C97760|nr:polysaccharide deacetylase family protein [Chryseobacterium sp.]TXF77223.1 polysaccharide deacetylase family protein [Chryseobacterium sp.]